MQKVPYPCIIDRMAVPDPVNMSDKYMPAQAWRAGVSKGLVLGSITPLTELEPGGFFYNYIDTSNPKLMSYETIYGGRKLSSGEKRSHHQILLAREWKYPVDYLDQNLILACEWKDANNLTMTIGGIATLKGITAEVELLDQDKSLEKQKFSVGNVSPDKVVSCKFPFRKKGNNPRLRVIFTDSSGKTVTDAVILKRVPFPLK